MSHPKPKSLGFLLVALLCCLLCSFTTLAVSINATAGILIDGDTGKVLYEKNADSMLLPGSMTKVMTCYIIFEEIQKGNLSFNTPITITYNQAQYSVDKSYPACVPLIAGSRVTVDTLLKLILLPSASASCMVMAETISGSQSAFVQRMNETAQRLGMTNTKYVNCHGAGYHYFSARDQARLVQVFLQQFPHFTNYTSCAYVTHNGVTYSNLNYMVNPNSTYYYPYAQGIKTGSYANAGSCLTSTAYRNGNRVIAVTFNSSSVYHQQTDGKNLLEYGLTMLEKQSYLSFHDTEAHVDVAPIYDTLNNLGVNLQSINGWVRPTEMMTYGEFATTFISVLEKLGIIPETNPGGSFYVSDLTKYPHYDILYRGISKGILPLQSNGTFNPNRNFTLDDFHVLVDWVSHLYPDSLTSPTKFQEIQAQQEAELLAQQQAEAELLAQQQAELLAQQQSEILAQQREEEENYLLSQRDPQTSDVPNYIIPPATNQNSDVLASTLTERAITLPLPVLSSETETTEKIETEKEGTKVANQSLARGYSIFLLYSFLQQNGYF